MEPVEGAPEEDQSIGEASRYFCPFPGCKRSFAELWRLKVHYRAPPDIRGSGKERGHGTELTHCPKCGKGLKPGKHHVGCSGGKAAPRQAKRQRQAAAASTMAAQEGMNGDAQAMYSNCMVMPGAYGQGLPAGMPPNGAGGVMQQQPQLEQQQSPTLGMGLGHDQLNSTGSAVLQGGTGDMLLGNPQGYQYQQQAMPLQQQPLMQMQQPQEQQELLQPHHDIMQPQQPMMELLDSSHLQQPQQQQQLIMQQPQIKQEPVSIGVTHTVTTASGAYLAQQQQQQQAISSLLRQCSSHSSSRSRCCRQRRCSRRRLCPVSCSHLHMVARSAARCLTRSTTCQLRVLVLLRARLVQQHSKRARARPARRRCLQTSRRLRAWAHCSTSRSSARNSLQRRAPASRWR
ncbi:hypothetical protein COO60DRAFT_1150704 [Scenedesmus sp. NREL 46B-D3]|nr:hypothetical protein COO60DRAFT_1150704 [Scenedesmus sp. NREL 46B-D3]